MPNEAPKVQIVQVATPLPPKPWYHSKTLWFNVSTVAATVPLLFEALASSLGLIEPIVPKSAYPAIVACISIVNLFLRAVTASGIAFRKPAEPQQ